MTLLPHLPARADLLADVRRMHEHATENRWQEALAIAQHLEASCTPLDVKSPHLAWALAVLHDNLGDLERALTYIVKAVNLDPLGPATDDSLRIIVDKVRKALATEEWKDESPRRELPRRVRRMPGELVLLEEARGRPTAAQRRRRASCRLRGPRRPARRGEGAVRARPGSGMVGG